MHKLGRALIILTALAACAPTPETPAPGTTGPAGAPQFRARTDERPPVDTGLSAGDRVFFAFDSAVIDAPMAQVLERQADWMRAHPRALFLLAGHADERGTREYNLALGARRAAAVRDYLVGLGIEPGRFRTTSYGKERPVVVGSDEAAWSLNRRVETLIDA